MKWLEFLLKRKLVVGLITLFVIFYGFVSIGKLDKELLPKVDFGGGMFTVEAGDLSAIEVERTITAPIEAKLKGMDGIDEVTSTTSDGVSNIFVLFEKDSDDHIFSEVESVIRSETANLPAVRDVFAMETSTQQGYEFYMSVSGGTMEEMTAFAKEVIEPRLEALDEVKDVAFDGILEHEIVIEFKKELFREKGLHPHEVMAAIQETNQEAVIGQITENGETRFLRWKEQVNDLDEVKNLKIQNDNTGEVVVLKDIADISAVPVEQSSTVWKNGESDFILVQIGRVDGVSQLEMAEAVREEVQKIKDENLVQGFEWEEIVAQADYVSEAIGGVTENILIGGVIAIAVLFLFLRTLRSTFVITLSIPISLLLTVSVMSILDYSFNMITLIGLALGVGMMVDASIVILESIYRKKEDGLKGFEAVMEGTKEVASAVTSSILTTVVVFLPIAIFSDNTGEVMVFLSVVVSVSLLSSLVTAFTVIPVLGENFAKPKKTGRKEGPILGFYSKIVRWITGKKRRAFAVTGIFVLMFAGSFFLVPRIPMTLMPDVLNRYAEIVVTLEPGITKEEKEELVEKISDTLLAIEDVESNYVMDHGNMLYLPINMTTGDEITREQRDVNEDILRSLRKLADDYPIEAVESALSAGGGGYPVQITVKGDSFDELRAISEDLIIELEKIDGIVAAKHSLEKLANEEFIQLREDKIEEEGLSATVIRRLLEDALFRLPAGFMTVGEETMLVTMTWDEKASSRNELLDLDVPTPAGVKKMSDFIELKTVSVPNEIFREDGDRVATVYADIEGRDLGAVNLDVQKLLKDFKVSDGYSVEAGGDLEEQMEFFLELLLIFAISMFLVYFVLTVQFNHLVHPLIVMSVVPITIVGAFLGLFLTQRELNFLSGIGIIILAAIVINNAILLIDRTNQLRRQGYSVNDALVEAGKNRMRPIFMTTLTTVGGMLPLALAGGSAGPYQAPLATVVVAGLMFGTLITLLLVPALYRLVSRRDTRFFKFRRRKDLKIDVNPSERKHKYSFQEGADKNSGKFSVEVNGRGLGICASPLSCFYAAPFIDRYFRCLRFDPAFQREVQRRFA